MRIGILTHPLRFNYGGILQCYALTVCLKKMGHDPIVIRREFDKSFFLWEWIRAILRFMHFPRYYSSNAVDRTVNIRPFVDKYIVRTLPIRSQKQIKKVCRKYDLDVVIVGSDQVWRADYALNFGYNYFLDFVPENVVRFSYAASFGLSEWNYTIEQTLHIKDLLKNFRGISVREEDGARLCRSYLDIDAQLVADPTILLSVADYDLIASSRLIKESYVFIYWLGDKKEIVPTIEKYKAESKVVVYVGLRDLTMFPSIADWLSYIKYADIVVTDSFHGCVFSLLYHRPLQVFENKSGGYGRIMSLIHMLGLTEEQFLQCDYDYYGIDKSISNIHNTSKKFIINSIA